MQFVYLHDVFHLPTRTCIFNYLLVMVACNYNLYFNILNFKCTFYIKIEENIKILPFYQNH